jgi:DNA-binding NtrC family response regulator
MNDNEQANAKQRILVIDDESSARFAVADFLETNGFEVATAWNGETAQEAFTNSPPDAIIVDYRLPDTDGLGLLAKFKAANAEIPVLILTAHGSIDLAVRAIKAGANQFMTKPMELPALLILLRQELASHHHPPLDHLSDAS